MNDIVTTEPQTASAITKQLMPLDNYSDSEASAWTGEKVRVKIAYIGGGSREWAVKLMADLALSDRICGQLDLYDIDASACAQNKALADAVFAHEQARTRFEVRVAPDLDSALRDADFVIVSIEPGPVTHRHADLEIPARYGVLQTVGDTTGPGGVLRAMRSVATFEQFGRSIAECCPEAWVINYTNPMAVCTASLFRYAPQLKAFGCCHEVFGTQEMLAKKVAQWFDVPVPARTQIQLEIAGVNHFTWATAARWRGHDLFPYLEKLVGDDTLFASRLEDAQQKVKDGKWFSSHHLVALDLFRRFGALGAAGDRHLSEFLPWYLTSEEELHRWGVLRTPYAWRVERTQGPRKQADEVFSDALSASGEEGVLQMEALLGLRELTTNINLPNRGQLPCAPKGVVVETYASFRENAICPLMAGEAPAGVRALIADAAHQQEVLLEALFNRRLEAAFEAMLLSPLVTIPTDKARAMFQEMVAAVEPMLGDWR